MLSINLLSTKNVLSVYVAQIILTEGVKNCSHLAQGINVSHDRFNRLLDQEEKIKCEFSDFAIRIICDLIIKDKSIGAIGVDDTHMSKRYSKDIVGVTEMYNTLEKRYEKCICVMTIFWTNGKITVPFAWLPYYGKDVPKDIYETKINLAKQLVDFALKAKIPFDYFVADGAFSTENFMKILISQGIKFVMRVKSTLVIETSSGSAQLKNHPDLKMRGRQKCKECCGSWKNMNLCFVAEKRTELRDPRTVFLVHNTETTCFEAASLYRMRWEVEKMHRFIKQKLGFCDCQSRSTGKQFAHINAVFIAYIFLQKIKYDNHDKSVYDTVNRLRAAKDKDGKILNQAIGELNAYIA